MHTSSRNVALWILGLVLILAIAKHGRGARSARPHGHVADFDPGATPAASSSDSGADGGALSVHDVRERRPS